MSFGYLSFPRMMPFWPKPGRECFWGSLISSSPWSISSYCCPCRCHFHLEKCSVSVASSNLIQTIKCGSVRTETALCDQWQVTSAAVTVMGLQKALHGENRTNSVSANAFLRKSRAGSSKLLNCVHISNHLNSLRGTACMIKVRHVLKYFAEFGP